MTKKKKVGLEEVLAAVRALEEIVTAEEPEDQDEEESTAVKRHPHSSSRGDPDG